MHVAVLGATGAVGRQILEVLSERALPVDRLTLFASARSAGSRVQWRGDVLELRAPEPGCFRGVDVALLSAGGDRSREWAPRAAAEGAIVIDNSSAFRMDSQVPLVVPEVNPGSIHSRPKGIIANPNCSTIQMVVALEPLRQVAGLSSIVLTTFQAVSGAGQGGLSALRREMHAAGESHGAEAVSGAADEGEARATAVDGSPFSRRIHANVVPAIGEFEATGWTEEEMKMIREPRKIFGLPELAVAPTCVRVPVEIGHSIQLAVETDLELSLDEARAALANAPGVVFLPEHDRFPTPVEVAGRDTVFVGRLRADPSRPRVLHLWVVADNLRKGAATNAVQIAERLADG